MKDLQGSDHADIYREGVNSADRLNKFAVIGFWRNHLSSQSVGDKLDILAGAKAKANRESNNSP
jgi:hypothetical protein